MTQGNESPGDNPKSRGLMPTSTRSRIGLGLAFLLIVVAAIAWLRRDIIVDDIIEDQLAGLGIEATYEIASVGPRRQIIRNVIVGDRVHPDLVIEEVEVRIAYGLGAPTIGSLKLVRPRLAARYDEVRGLSFGVLDKVIFAPSEEPAELPDIDLQIVEGRLDLASPAGDATARIDGEGGLAGGFSARLSAHAPELTFGNCKAAATSFAGSLSVESRKPKLEGPLRLGAFGCGDGAGAQDPVRLELALEADRDLAGAAGTIRLAAGRLAQGTTRLGAASGGMSVRLREGILSARFELAGNSLSSPQFSASSIALHGEFRSQTDAGRAETRGTFSAQGLQPGRGLLNSLNLASRSASGTLAQPLVSRFRSAMARETRNSSFVADFLVRQGQQSTSMIVPQAVWRSRSKGNLLSLSQVQLGTRSGQISRLSGNFVSGGMDLPQLSGRMEQTPVGNSVLRIRMEPYAAGSASIAAPQLTIARSDRGDLELSGSLVVSGPVAGGKVQRLALPLSGGWSKQRGAWLWQRCSRAAIGQLEFAGLVLERQWLRFCPAEGRPVVVFGQGDVQVDISIPQQQWQGNFDGQDARLGLASARFSSSRGLAANDVHFASGEGEEVTRFAVNRLEGDFKGGVGGNFAGGEFALGPVPFDFEQVNGNWSYREGTLHVAGSSLVMEDRARPKRFNTMLARDFALTYANGMIRTDGTMRNAASDRAIFDVSIVHEFAGSKGHADLAVPDLTFDKELQPEQLSNLALGVIALAQGRVTGEGRIEWRDGEVTSKGELRTDRLDFAAEFGPVKGVSGTVRFSDLVSLTTEPDQRLQIGSMNPGIEVLDGEMLFELRGGQIFSIRQGSWPFLGGTLTLRPVDLNFGAAEERRYIIEISGADAAQFIATMEMTNLSASGVFDGTMPIVFDEFGNGRIENGLLISRPPGGSISYVGELTYEDLSAIGNFAFASLRSLDYTQMMVEMNGPLIGEIVTRLRFDGVRQGEKASRNIVTRQIAKLPVQFRVNLRAPFYQLLTSFESMYDPSFLRDPRDLGLLETDGTRFVRPGDGKPVTSDEPSIQGQESERVP